jgi:hypothetical protein
MIQTKITKQKPIVLKDDERLRLIGSPRVFLFFGAGETTVTVEPRPWGMPDPTRTFLGGTGVAARKYARDVFADLIERAEKQRSYKQQKANHKGLATALRRLGEEGEQ